MLALGAGIIEGSGFGINTTTAFIVRGTVEIQKFACKEHLFCGEGIVSVIYKLIGIFWPIKMMTIPPSPCRMNQLSNTFIFNNLHRLSRHISHLNYSTWIFLYYSFETKSNMVHEMTHSLDYLELAIWCSQVLVHFQEIELADSDSGKVKNLMTLWQAAWELSKESQHSKLYIVMLKRTTLICTSQKQYMIISTVVYLSKLQWKD